MTYYRMEESEKQVMEVFHSIQQRLEVHNINDPMLAAVLTQAVVSRQNSFDYEDVQIQERRYK